MHEWGRGTACTGVGGEGCVHDWAWRPGGIKAGSDHRGDSGFDSFWAVDGWQDREVGIRHLGSVILPTHRGWLYGADGRLLIGFEPTPSPPRDAWPPRSKAGGGISRSESHPPHATRYPSSHHRCPGCSSAVHTPHTWVAAQAGYHEHATHGSQRKRDTTHTPHTWVAAQAGEQHCM